MSEQQENVDGTSCKGHSSSGTESQPAMSPEQGQGQGQQQGQSSHVCGQESAPQPAAPAAPESGPQGYPGPYGYGPNGPQGMPEMGGAVFPPPQYPYPPQAGGYPPVYPQHQYGYAPAPQGYGMPGYPDPYGQPYGQGWGVAQQGGPGGQGGGQHAGAHAGQGQGNGYGAGMADFVDELNNGGTGLASLSRMLNFNDTDFWKGALVGAAAVLLLTNGSVQKTLSSFTGAGAKSGDEKEPEA